MVSRRGHGDVEMGRGDREEAKVGWLMLFNDTWCHV